MHLEWNQRWQGKVSSSAAHYSTKSNLWLGLFITVRCIWNKSAFIQSRWAANQEWRSLFRHSDHSSWIRLSTFSRQNNISYPSSCFSMALVTESWRGSWSLSLSGCASATRSLEVNINQSIKRGPKWPTATHARGFRWCRPTKGVVSRSTAESDPNGQSGSEVNLFPICHASAFIAGWAVPSFIWYLANWQHDCVSHLEAVLPTSYCMVSGHPKTVTPRLQWLWFFH